MDQDQKIIFLNSYLPRTGHNFAAEVLKIFTDHEVLPHNRSETRLSTILDQYFKFRNQKVRHHTDQHFLNDIFLKEVRSNILKKSTRRYIMIKDTSLVGVDWLPIVFPNDHHIVLVRDPKNVFLSLLKGMTLKKHSIRNRLKKITKPLGIYPYTYSKKLSQLVLSQLPDLSNHKIIRYEALVQKEEQVLKELKSQFGCTKSIGQIKVEIDSIQVINSSFFKETGGKKIWDLKPRTSKFDPVNRKSENVLIQKGVELGSKKLRKKLNYI